MAADSFFGFNAAMPAYEDEALAELDPSLSNLDDQTFDVRNDDTFGSGAVEDDWEAAHKKLSAITEALPGWGKSKEPPLPTSHKQYDERHRQRTGIVNDEDEDEANLEEEEEILEQTLAKLVDEDEAEPSKPYASSGYKDIPRVPSIPSWNGSSPLASPTSSSSLHELISPSSNIWASPNRIHVNKENAIKGSSNIPSNQGYRDRNQIPGRRPYSPAFEDDAIVKAMPKPETLLPPSSFTKKPPVNVIRLEDLEKEFATRSSPTRQLSDSQQPPMTPQQQMATPQQQMATPQQQMATPQQQMATPQQQMATPQQQMATPQQQMATPLQSMSAPIQPMSAPQQPMSTPQPLGRGKPPPGIPHPLMTPPGFPQMSPSPHMPPHTPQGFRPFPMPPQMFQGRQMVGKQPIPSMGMRTPPPQFQRPTLPMMHSDPAHLMNRASMLNFQMPPQRHRFSTPQPYPQMHRNYPDNRGNQYDHRGNQYDNRGNQYDNRGNQYDRHGNQYDQRGNQYNQHGNQYDHRGNQYDQRSNQYDQRGNQYDNRGNYQRRYDDNRQSNMHQHTDLEKKIHEILTRDEYLPSNDPYAGLMTRREKEWIIKIQLLQLTSSTPDLDDYYFQTYIRRKQAKERARQGEVQPNRPGTTSQMTLPQFEREARHYKPLDFQGTLGKVSATSISHPRQMVELDHISKTSDQEKVASSITKDIKRRRQILSVIEKAYVYLLQLDELERKLVHVDPDERNAMLETKQTTGVKLFNLLKLNVRTESSGKCDEEFFVQLLSIRKGKVLLSRMLPAVKQPEAEAILLSLTRNIVPVIKKDSQDEVLPLLITPTSRVVEQGSSAVMVQSLKNIVLGNKDSQPQTAALATVLVNQFGLNLLSSLLKKCSSVSSSFSDNKGELKHSWESLVSQVAKEFNEVPVKSLSKNLLAVTPLVGTLTGCTSPTVAANLELHYRNAISAKEEVNS